MIELLKSLIKIESLSGQEDVLVAYLSTILQGVFPGGVETIGCGRNILVDPGPRDGDVALLLCSHLDTVPPCNGWTRNPFQASEEGQRIYGLGANDALASVVSMIEALSAEYKGLKKRVLLLLACEEEKGGNGFAALEPELPPYSFAVFGEPTGMDIGYCMRGAMQLMLTSRGRSCHASRPHEGKNAVFALSDDLTKIRKLPLKDDSPWGGASIQPTLIKGGTAVNQIPDLVETHLDIRTTSQVNNQKIVEMLTLAGLEFEVLHNRRHPMRCEETSELVSAARRAGPSARLVSFGGTCDMAFSRAPSIVFGPGRSERSHAADEYIEKEELEHARDVYSRLIREVAC